MRNNLLEKKEEEEGARLHVHGKAGGGGGLQPWPGLLEVGDILMVTWTARQDRRTTVKS